MEKIKIDDMDVVVGTKKEAFWSKALESTEKDIEKNEKALEDIENNIVFLKAIKEMIFNKMDEEAKK
jgi:hypothetical protein